MRLAAIAGSSLVADACCDSLAGLVIACWSVLTLLPRRTRLDGRSGLAERHDRFLGQDAELAAVRDDAQRLQQHRPMTHRPADTRMYVTTEQGSIFVVNENASGATSPSLFFNAASAVQTATGRTMNYSGSQQGLQSVAFHPDFDNVGSPGYGKLYTTMFENRPANPNSPEFFYLGNSTYGGGGADGVLAEWTFNHDTGQVNANSYRELFRANMPNYDHPIKQAQFNPYASPGDEDYGLLYMTHGDSNNQDSLNDDPQDRGDVMGKMLRINPLSQSAGIATRFPRPTRFSPPPRRVPRARRS